MNFSSVQTDGLLMGSGPNRLGAMWSGIGSSRVNVYISEVEGLRWFFNAIVQQLPVDSCFLCT